MRNKAEEALHLKICEYLRTHYPDVIFRTDFSSGMRMSIGQARKHKKFQSSRAYPDLFIAEPQFDGYEMKEAGLFLEIKAVNIYKKDGTLRKNPHIEEQARMLERLERVGYVARFVCSFEEAVEAISDYLGRPKDKKIEF